MQKLGKHDRRFLLFAECQVGKTGAFLHFLSELRKEIEQHDMISSSPPPASIFITQAQPWCNWLVPRIEDLLKQGPFAYTKPIDGKYHRAIACHRLAKANNLILDSSSSSSNIAEGFIQYVQDNERTVTKRGLDLLDALRKLDFSIIVREEGFIKAALATLLNWDGRFPPRRSATARMFDGTDKLLDEFAGSLTKGERCAIKKAKEQLWSEDSVDDPIVYDDEEPEQLDLSKYFEVKRSIVVVTAEYKALKWKGNDKGRVCESMVIPYPKIHDCKLSIPFDALDRSKLNSSDPEGIINALKHPKKIKSWIFTASYCGRTGPGEKLLVRDDAFSVPDRVGNRVYNRLKKWDDYAELLIVRKYQFADYRSLYGSTHVIASIPDEVGGVTVKDGGIGYARLFGQCLAYWLGLKAVWMLDDNILQCWKIPYNWNNGKPDPSEPASFAEVMIHIESLFQDCSWERSLYPNMKEQAENALQLSGKRTLQEIVGGFDRYGVVGLCRGQQWRQNISQPIKRSYSVYSFFLLNVAKTWEKGLLFPCRPIWEDIEFNNFLDENGLMVCKMQVFSHEKPLRRQPEPQPPLLSPSDSMAQWLNQNFKLFPSNCKDIMTIKSKDAELVGVHDKLLTTLQSSQTIGGDDGAFFVHNPTVEQFGALAGESILPNLLSKELFILNLLRNLETSTDCFLNGGKYVFVIGNGKRLIKGLSEDDMTPLHWKFAVSELEVEKLNSIPENIAKKFVIIQISKKVPLSEKSSSQVPRINLSTVDLRLPTDPERSVSSSNNKRKPEDTVNPPRLVPQRRMELVGVTGEEWNQAVNGSRDSEIDDPRNLTARKGRPRITKHHSAAYDGKRWLCCHQKNLTADGCQNNDADGKPRHHPMGAYMELTWPCCGKQHGKAGKNEGCQLGLHPNHHP